MNKLPLIARFRKLSAGERIAIITGFFVVFAAIIQIMPALITPSPLSHTYEGNYSTYPNITILSTKLISGPSSHGLSDGYGNSVRPPYIDLTLINNGNKPGVIYGLDLEIINASLNMTPVLYFFNRHSELNGSNMFKTAIMNGGWGPADILEYNASMDFGLNTSHLRIVNNYLNWTGYINPGERLFLNFKYYPENDYYISSDIDRPDDFISEGYVLERIKYRDLYNVILIKNITTKAYLCKVNRSSSLSVRNGLYRIQDFSAEIINPLEILKVDQMDPEKSCPYNISLNVNHYIKENQVDRMIIKLDSIKSGIFQSKIKVNCNSEKPVNSEILRINMVKRNINYQNNIRYINISI